MIQIRSSCTVFELLLMLMTLFSLSLSHHCQIYSHADPTSRGQPNLDLLQRPLRVRILHPRCRLRLYVYGVYSFKGRKECGV
ncbi:pentatricopeptide repeat-containing protein, mitochondrial [Iris pallida]|uniref:Pentatricopeptide repeat-containing protein, mitochondrial n=1 Tax=Iris pallida TaxID=29817 RepID=A0AAX6I1U2_IRIPA|nr:pentatricopeptide repeat-containing protein, mitochondrial [Iris pallida]